MPQIANSWFYTVTEKAEPIFKALFKEGLRPGQIVTVSDEDLKILREGVSYFPLLLVAGEKRIVTPGAAH